MSSDTKRMAKNTIFLYIRSFITLVIALYSSRVILDNLGVDDYGLYQVVGGVVGVLAFFTGSLTSAGSRFLTFELGRRDKVKLKEVFNTLMTVHIVIVFVILILAETLGLWFIQNKSGISVDNLAPAVWAYHFSVLTSCFAFIQVPYVSLVIAREEMDVFAWLSIAWSLCKLIVAFCVGFFVSNKLPIYAVLLSVFQLLITLSYFVYCFLKFPESRFRFSLNKELLKEISSYTGWNTVSSLASVLNLQGLNIITNVFFSPAVVAARAISVQVSSAVGNLYHSFRNSINPQIIKRYAAGDKEGSKNLLLITTRYSFYLLFFIGLPVILVAKDILSLWLGQVPDYTVIFLQLIMIESFFAIFDGCFTTALVAKGQIKENSILSPIFLFLKFPIVYFMFKSGFSPVALSYVGIVAYFIMGCVMKPILLCRICDYKLMEFVTLYKQCFATIIIPVITALFIGEIESTSLWRHWLLVCLYISVVNVVCMYFIGVEKRHKSYLFNIIKGKIQNL